MSTKTNCVYYKKNRRGGCTINKTLVCRTKECNDYTTNLENKINKQIKEIEQKKQTDPNFFKKCKTDCAFFEDDDCIALKTLFCYDEKCKFYKKNNKELIRWTEMQKTADNGWKEKRKYGNNGVC